MVNNLANAVNPASLSFRFRTRRDAVLRDFLQKVPRVDAQILRICDLGGGVAYWERVGLDWLEDHAIHITCINSSADELTRDSQSAAPITLAVGDACDMGGHADNSFDVVHSNSVIEHVGGWSRIVDFSRQVRRLAPSYYVQTPYFWFPFDPHFYRVPCIHWLPPSFRAKLHRRVKAGWAQPDGTLDQAMGLAMSNFMLDRSQYRFLFPDAEHRFEFFAGLPKSMLAMRLASTSGKIS
ncbi:MAG: methyltransferase domain-containing protein [Novosphingobium sp.]